MSHNGFNIYINETELYNYTHTMSKAEVFDMCVRILRYPIWLRLPVSVYNVLHIPCLLLLQCYAYVSSSAGRTIEVMIQQSGLLAILDTVRISLHIGRVYTLLPNVTYLASKLYVGLLARMQYVNVRCTFITVNMIPRYISTSSELRS